MDVTSGMAAAIELTDAVIPIRKTMQYCLKLNTDNSGLWVFCSVELYKNGSPSFVNHNNTTCRRLCANEG